MLVLLRRHLQPWQLHHRPCTGAPGRTVEQPEAGVCCAGGYKGWQAPGRMPQDSQMLDWSSASCAPLNKAQHLTLRGLPRQNLHPQLLLMTCYTADRAAHLGHAAAASQQSQAGRRVLKLTQHAAVAGCRCSGGLCMIAAIPAAVRSTDWAVNCTPVTCSPSWLAPYLSHSLGHTLGDQLQLQCQKL